MNKTAYISLLKNSMQENTVLASSMEELVDTFPYHATSHILMAKSANNDGSMYATKKLKHASLFSPNRAHLRKIFQQNSQIQAKNNLETISEFINPISTIEEINYFDNKLIDSIQTAQIVDIANVEIPFLNEIVDTEVIAKNENTLKYYVHVTGFGNSPKTVKQDLLTEFLAFRGEIVFENAPLDFQQNMIQKFLEDEPKISRFEPQAVEVGKVDLSKRSTTENDDLITENMANIFVKQSKYKRAIEVYQKLILKYPEKETYFAEKIISLQYHI